VGSQSHIHLWRAKEVPDGAPKQARWTPIVPIAQNRSSVRLHCRIVHKYPLLLLTAARRPLLAIPPRRPVAGASCARKFRVDIRTSYRPPEGMPARRSAGLRGGCGVLCLDHNACDLYDRDPGVYTCSRLCSCVLRSVSPVQADCVCTRCAARVAHACCPTGYVCVSQLPAASHSVGCLGAFVYSFLLCPKRTGCIIYIALYRLIGYPSSCGLPPCTPLF
jgi:hypothetical protein